MNNVFGAEAMAEGYASSRPRLHPLIMDRVRMHLPWTGKVARALDVGCGAGLSASALEGIADRCIAIDPAELMLRWIPTVAPFADPIAARAEAIPIRSHCIDLITAAGSLNYADLSLFFKEAARILVPGGLVVVYDFAPAKSFRDSGALDRWFSAFVERYPWPSDEAHHLDPERLSAMDTGFRLQAHDRFEIGMALKCDFYLEYMMTETNVAHALRRGVSEAEIRSWCSATLGPVWGNGPRQVLFRGYYVCLVAPR